MRGMSEACPDTIAALFGLLGGTGAAARAMGVRQSTASEMKRRGSIPVAYWRTLIRAAGERHFILDEALLVSLHLKDTTRSAVVAGERMRHERAQKREAAT